MQGRNGNMGVSERADRVGELVTSSREHYLGVEMFIMRRHHVSKKCV
jgi:hypothetical protein